MAILWTKYNSLILNSWMLGPYVASSRNNDSFYRYNNKTLLHAIYRGRIVRSILPQNTFHSLLTLQF